MPTVWDFTMPVGPALNAADYAPAALLSKSKENADLNRHSTKKAPPAGSPANEAPWGAAVAGAARRSNARDRKSACDRTLDYPQEARPCHYPPSPPRRGRALMRQGRKGRGRSPKLRGTVLAADDWNDGPMRTRSAAAMRLHTYRDERVAGLMSRSSAG
jgi:hypothetical protein